MFDRVLNMPMISLNIRKPGNAKNKYYHYILSIVKPCESKRYNIRCAIKKLKNNFTKEKLYLIVFFPIFHFDPLESMRKPFDILCFEENQKGTLGRKGLKEVSKTIFSKRI